MYLVYRSRCRVWHSTSPQCTADRSFPPQHYQCVRKYKDRLFINVKFLRALYLRTEWYLRRQRKRQSLSCTIYTHRIHGKFSAEYAQRSRTATPCGVGEVALKPHRVGRQAEDGPAANEPSRATVNIDMLSPAFAGRCRCSCGSCRGLRRN